MSVANLPPSAPRRFAVPPEPVLTLTVEQYHAMIRSKALVGMRSNSSKAGWHRHRGHGVHGGLDLREMSAKRVSREICAGTCSSLTGMKPATVTAFKPL